MSDVPGQPRMVPGDLLVAINGRSLALQLEDDADEVLASELRHGATLRLQRAKESLAELLGSRYGTPGQEPPEWPEVVEEEEEEEVMVFQAQPEVREGGQL